LIERYEKNRGNIDICVADEAAIKAAAADPVLSEDEGTTPIPSFRSLSIRLSMRFLHAGCRIRTLHAACRLNPFPSGERAGRGVTFPSSSCGGSHAADTKLYVIEQNP
jgi:hypothetical protein